MQKWGKKHMEREGKSICFSKLLILIIIIFGILINLPKTQNFDCLGRGDLTSLFKSCEIDRSQGRLV